MAETMSVPQPLLSVLRLIADQLRGTPITWAVTGSCSLALQGLPVVVHDIAVRTTAKDAYALEAVFSSYQKRPVHFATTGTVQSHFGALEINAIQVEIIGDMQHRLADGTWEPVVDMNRCKVWVRLGDNELPVMALPLLYQAYQLLGRADKVAVLKNWLEDLHPIHLDAVVQDVTDAIAYVRAHAADLHVDRDRLCLWMGSAGAVAGLRVGLANPQPFVRCLVSYYGLFDLALYAQARELPTPAPDVLQALAPLTYLRQHRQHIPPLLIARMEHDIPGLNVAVDAFVAAARDVEAPVEIANYPDGHHGFDTEDDNEQSRAIIAQTLSFMHRHLGQQPRG